MTRRAPHSQPKWRKGTRRPPQATDLNEQLNHLHGEAICRACGRQYPKVMLNIEAVIHHNCLMLCLNTGACERYMRRKKMK